MSVKKPAKPIPESSYERFKYKLQEISGKLSDRNLTLFLLGVATGYRMQDLVDLAIADIQEAIANGYFEIQEKKQYETWKTHKKDYPNSTQKIPEKRRHEIVKQLEIVLKKYIKGKRKSEFAFPSQQGDGSKYILQSSYSEVLKKVATCKEINLKNISGHSLRKIYATRLYEETHDLEFVRIALGHKSIEVTKRYLGLDDKVKEDAAKIAARKL